jgi:hypothetical protein
MVESVPNGLLILFIFLSLVHGSTTGGPVVAQGPWASESAEVIGLG